MAEDADLMVRFGPGHYADVEHVEIARDVLTPLASPALCRAWPLRAPDDLEDMPLLRSPLEPWRTWFAAATGLARAPRWLPVQRHRPDVRRRRRSHGRGARCASSWPPPGQQHGRLVRLFDILAPSPYAHYLCWAHRTIDQLGMRGLLPTGCAKPWRKAAADLSSQTRLQPLHTER